LSADCRRQRRERRPGAARFNDLARDRQSLCREVPCAPSFISTRKRCSASRRWRDVSVWTGGSLSSADKGMVCSTVPKRPTWRVVVVWNGDVPVSVVSVGFAWAGGAAPARKAPHEVPPKRQRGAVWQKPRRGETGITIDFILISIRNGDVEAMKGANGVPLKGKACSGGDWGIAASDFWHASHGLFFPGAFPKTGKRFRGSCPEGNRPFKKGEVHTNLAFSVPWTLLPPRNMGGSHDSYNRLTQA